MSNRIQTRSRTRAAATAESGQRLVTPSPLTTVSVEEPSSPPSHSHSSPASPTSPSSQNKCAICLSNVLNKCKPDTCIHEFCFGCLLEWSKVKAECPLCKKHILKISHNFRSGPNGQELCDEYNVPTPRNVDHYFVAPPTLRNVFTARFGSGPLPLSSLGFPRTNFGHFMESFVRFNSDRFARISGIRSAPDTSGASLQRDLTQHVHQNSGILQVGPMSTESRASSLINSNNNSFDYFGNSSRRDLFRPLTSSPPIPIITLDSDSETVQPEVSTSQLTEVSRPSVIVPGSANGNNSDDSDDYQLVGIHPIVKPPPLAVITIDSDDDEPKSPKSTGAEAAQPDSDGSITTSVHFMNKPYGVLAEAELLDIDEASSSSSVHMLTERPASPKPSTSAVSREIRENQFNLNSVGRANRSDFSLTRLFEDFQKNEQDSCKWSESEDEEEVLDLEERNMQASGRKSRRLSSASSTVSRAVSSSPDSLGSGPQDLMAGQNQTQTAIHLSRDTGESPTLPSVLNNIMKVEGTDKRRWESDDDQSVSFDCDGNLNYFKPSGPFVSQSSSSSACSSRSEDSAGLVRVKRPRRSQNDDQKRRGDDNFESVTFEDDLIDLSGFGSRGGGGGGGLRSEPLTNDDMCDSTSLVASPDLD